MTQWLVSLSGDPYSLGVLSRLLCSPELSVVEEGGQCFLASQDFEVLADAGSARARAADLVGVANGLVLLNRPRNFRAVALGSVVYHRHEDGRQDATLFVGAGTAIAEALAPTILIDGVVVGGPEDSTTPGSPYRLGVELRNDPRVRDALRFFASRDNWAVSLYKVYEVIGLDVGEAALGRPSTLGDGGQDVVKLGWGRIVEDEGWAERGEAVRFKASVNSPEAVGGEARHAVQRSRPPNAPMHEREATEWIGAVLEHWLRWKRAGTVTDSDG